MSILNGCQLDKLAAHFTWKKVTDHDLSSSCMEYAAKDSYRIFHDVIKSVGKHCERYASDLCYDVTEFPETCGHLDDEFRQMSEQEQKEWLSRSHAVRLIGVRDSGVDHSEFVNSRLEQGDLYVYKDLFKIEVKVVPHVTYTDFVFTLYRAARKGGAVQYTV